MPAKVGSRDHRMEIYDHWLHLVTTAKQWAELTARFETEQRIPGLGGVTRVIDTQPAAGDSGVHYLIWVDHFGHKGQPKAVLVGTVAHEASHIAGQILEHINEVPTNDSEARAYLVGWISTWIWDRL